jgi:hypothetical protein
MAGSTGSNGLSHDSDKNKFHNDDTHHGWLSKGLQQVLQISNHIDF